jgi:uncharacterized protein (TIGR04255 family)
MSDTPGLPSYNKPPVIEVIYGVAFSALEKLRAPHTGLFWSKIRDRFPKTAHAAPVGKVPKEINFGALPLPRIWYMSEDENFLVQLQSNRFLFNWRIIRPTDEYPRFDVVQNGFQRHFSIFKEFVDSESLGELDLESYELAYINHIERSGKLEDLKYVGSLFPDLRWRAPTNRYLPIPSHLTWSVGFEFGTKGRLGAELKPAYRQSDKKELFVFELKATGSATAVGNENTNDGFEQAREWIVGGFADLTSEKAQSDLWGLENSNG